MQNKTTMHPTLESISSDLLLHVAGGCHKKGGCHSTQQVTTTINAPVTQYLLPQIPAPPQPQLPPELPPEVSTSVSVNGQPPVTV